MRWYEKDGRLMLTEHVGVSLNLLTEIRTIAGLDGKQEILNILNMELEFKQEPKLTPQEIEYLIKVMDKQVNGADNA